MSNIEKMIEQKEKLQEKIKKEKEKEYIKFGRWFFNKTSINSSSEAKKYINKHLDFSTTENNYQKEINENDSFH
ncbi:TPA: hypothetical protein O1I00_002633 [Staphylococcus aureus]|uniref:hypothetical protein n=1 Tax=Staphylococcus TaxID=1279 RepID=UPI0005C13426|nr:hypothetical protein [Staphylococcus aureus]AQR26682.1 hypothetical protein AYM28_15410 [Staphylococcus aureus]AQR53201.1 hypothetical protein AYM37_15410 [Staphylococcus aureus]KIT67607.1 recombinase RmuC [Staphylococcus aureus]MBO8865166.1 hypothetical protein [Staphylococcus aureus]CAC9314736.1 Uncharacterised protein [Staphylococcus aureus]